VVTVILCMDREQQLYLWFILSTYWERWTFVKHGWPLAVFVCYL